jgi:hypothetical protein
VPAAAAATAAMALGPWWLTNAALGNSEGILTAAALWAVIAHLSGRRSAAILLGLVAAALRPEVWPFLFVYGVWAWRADPGTRPALVFAAVAVPVLWFGPDVTGGGGALGASRAARGTPSEGSAALADVPLLAIVWDAVKIGGIPVTVCAALAAVDASPWRARRWTLTWILALGAVAWVLIVAAMTVGGFAGNPRYLVVAAAVFAVLAGVGAVRLVDAARLPVAAVALLPLSVGALAFAGLRDDMRDVGVRADRWDALPRLVAAAGGRDALVRCAPIRTAAVVRGLVAWRLDLPPFGINAKPVPPAVVLRMRPYDGGPVDPPLDTSGYRLLAREPGWEAWGACRG